MSASWAHQRTVYTVSQKRLGKLSSFDRFGDVGQRLGLGWGGFVHNTSLDSLLSQQQACQNRSTCIEVMTQTKCIPRTQKVTLYSCPIFKFCAYSKWSSLLKIVLSASFVIFLANWRLNTQRTWSASPLDIANELTSERGWSNWTS